MKKKVRYHSPTREQQALETRENILNAAEKLLQTKGYVGMTVEAMAKEASVAPQTVYAVFGSKRGILLGLIQRAVLQKLDLKIFDIDIGFPEPVHCTPTMLLRVLDAFGDAPVVAAHFGGYLLWLSLIHIF